MKLIPLMSALATGLLTVITVPSALAQSTTFERLSAEGDLALDHGNFADAKTAYGKALGEIRDTPEDRHRLPLTLSSLAAIYNLQGHYTEAESLCLRALAIIDKAPDIGNSTRADLFSTLADLKWHLGNYSKAGKYIREAIEIRKNALSRRPADLLANYVMLAKILCVSGRCKEADQVIRKGLRMCESGGPECQVGTAAARAALGTLSATQKHYREAEGDYQEAVRVLETVLGSSNPTMIPIQSQLAFLYLRTGKYPEAERAGQRALEIAAKTMVDSDETAMAALVVGEAFAARGLLDTAEPFFREAIGTYERAHGSDSVEKALALQHYARFLKKAKRSAEASEVEDHANSMLKRAKETVDVSQFPTEPRDK